MATVSMLHGEAHERLDVLLVGIDGIGKRQLAASMVDASARLGVEMDVELPLKTPVARRVDYVVFMCDMKSKLSLERLYESAAHLNQEYALGRASLVVLNSETPVHFAFSLVLTGAEDEAVDLADKRGMHAHYCMLDDLEVLNKTALRLVKRCQRTTRPEEVPPLFLGCLDTEFLSAA